MPEGDLRDLPFTNNRFANCQVGIWLASELSAWFHLTNSVFENFQVAGIGGHPSNEVNGAPGGHPWNGVAPPLFTPGGQLANYNWKLEGNRFRFLKASAQPTQ